MMTQPRRQYDGATTPPPVGAAALVGEELAAAFINAVRFQAERLGIPLDEAVADAAGIHDAPITERLRTTPPTQVSWLDVAQLVQQAPDAVQDMWNRLVDVARAELASGQRTARTHREDTSPYERAQFIALRDGFCQQWQPQGGIEDALVDSLALAYTDYLAWTARLHVLSSTEARHEDVERERSGVWDPPRVEVAAWIEQAAQMADRFHRLFLRTLRALQDYRRGPSPRVAISQAGQVNVGGAQVNVAAPPAPDAASATDAGV